MFILIWFLAKAAILCSSHAQNSYFHPLIFLRYVELNTKLQSNYRQYNDDVPTYLHERPHSVIKHCMERLASSENTPADDIKLLDENNGTFKVRSQDDPTKLYTVSFGNDSSGPVIPPGCDCFDWERNRLPCKHFFAIFKNHPVWSFEKLPK